MPEVHTIAISNDRIHELAVPISESIVIAVGPILTRYAHDDAISPEEFSLSIIYAHCQGVAAMISSAVAKGARRDQLREFVNTMLDNLEPGGTA